MVWNRYVFGLDPAAERLLRSRRFSRPPFSVRFPSRILAGRRPPARRYWHVLLLAFAGFALQTPAQELRHQSHPLSTYLDLRPAVSGAPAQTTPSWIEAIEFHPKQEHTQLLGGGSIADGTSTFRIRLQRPTHTQSEQLQARIFFEDRATGMRPQFTVWNELGEKLLPSASLGQNLGLPSSETLTVPMRGADYLEIESDGDGSQIRGIFLSWLEPTGVLEPSDFLSKEKVRQPFRILSAARKLKNDSYLYGVVTASLHTGDPLLLKPTDCPTASLSFDLERQPLVAVVTYEVLGASIDAPPAITVNGHTVGESSIDLPDLADPGYQGQSREAQVRLGFRYTGWLHAQRLIPGDLLKAGLNSLTVGLSNGADAVAVRSVSIQLKYNWEKLDYVLAPATAAHETP